MTSDITARPKKTKPYVYVRYNIPEKYQLKMKEICEEVIVEPWVYGTPEPTPSIDLTKVNVIATLGIQDSLNILSDTPNVKWVQSLSVGIEAMFHEEVRNSDLVITNVKGCTSIPIAEHTIAMITAFSRGVPTMIRNQGSKTWHRIQVLDLENATVGIIGYGGIGQEIAKRCKALGMNVIGCRKHPGKSSDVDPADQIVGLNLVDEVLAQSDFLILTLPSTDETLRFMDREKFSKMKKGSYFINIGRGNTIIEDELLQVLQNGHLSGAALDVFDVEPLPQDHPFWTQENVIISPHNAFYSPKTMDRYMDLFIENLKRYANHEPLLNIVDKELGY
ncbi:D-2-hydroxyacid dehydrogenase [Bacillus sp. PS06]|uniref:D-2-hydroxyacid dehydrogenase n=1 Tax=Bacillus sp. PS06 TaxID=2764176 RepID=UPI00177E6DB1|nr:D-2-hydroxyacid dehydrogenase [Bacillus sp. PS06]MBD8069071.1 D-2-hydroxyacid dehydrogenase [Bacillus sp. PS06]